MRYQTICALASALLVASCRIVMDVPEGGRVYPASGAFGACESGQTCEVQVTDIYFDEKFLAVPNEGFRFVEWEKRDRGLCGGDQKACHLYTSGFEGNEILMAFLESADEVFYLNPVFEPSSGSTSGTGCHFTQSTPMGDLDACQTQQTTESCAILGGNLIAPRCTANSPKGFCNISPTDGNTYFYDGDVGELQSHCEYTGGVWTTL